MTAEIHDFALFDLDNYRPHMLPKVRSDAIMAAAAGMPCNLRISSFLPGLRCSGRDTTVACHTGSLGKGTSTKTSDLSVAFACSNCHDLLDGRNLNGWSYLIEHHPAAVLERILAARDETLHLLLICGVIVVPDARMV